MKVFACVSQAGHPHNVGIITGVDYGYGAIENHGYAGYRHGYAGIGHLWLKNRIRICNRTGWIK